MFHAVFFFLVQKPLVEMFRGEVKPLVMGSLGGKLIKFFFWGGGGGGGVEAKELGGKLPLHPLDETLTTGLDWTTGLTYLTTKVIFGFSECDMLGYLNKGVCKAGRDLKVGCV